MYFLSEEERKRLLRGLLPKARSMTISEELRGWSWNTPPLEPIYDVKLALFEVANKYCPTSRDTYLRRVLGITPPPNKEMIEGIVFDETISRVITLAKKIIYGHGVKEVTKILPDLSSPDYSPITPYEERLNSEELEVLKEKAKILWEFEQASILSRIKEALSKQPYINEDSLAYQAIPFVVGQKMDGSFLGLSSHLTADAFTFATPMILDLKFDIKRDFHRLSTTGYALVMEAVYEYPVDVGCIVYGRFKGKRLLIEREFHLIDEECRQWFIEERDEKMRMVYEEIDPGLPEKCYTICPFLKECRAS